MWENFETYSNSIIGRSKKSTFKKQPKKHKRKRRCASPTTQRRRELENKIDKLIDQDLEEFRKIPKEQLRKFMAGLYPDKLQETPYQESRFEEIQKHYINPVRDMIQSSLESAGKLFNQLNQAPQEKSSDAEDEESTEEEIEQNSEDNNEEEEEVEQQDDEDNKQKLDIQVTNNDKEIFEKQPAQPSVTITKTLHISDRTINNDQSGKVTVNLSEMNRMIESIEKRSMMVDINQKKLDELPKKFQKQSK